MKLKIKFAPELAETVALRRIVGGAQPERGLQPASAWQLLPCSKSISPRHSFWPLNLNSAVEIAARERKEHKDSRCNDATAGSRLPPLGEAKIALAVSSNAFVSAFFAFSCGHSIAASRLKRRERRAPAFMRAGPLLAAALAVLLVSGCKPRGGGAGQYETAAVSRGDLVEHVTASGTLSAVVSVDVGCRVSGQVSALYVDFNSPVKKGALIAEIDPTVYQAQLRETEGELASARADVTLKHQNLERKKTLVPLKAASQLDLDQATAELAQAEATVIIREAALQSAQANLGYCKITAPVDGIVISRAVDLGQTVNAAMSTPVLFTIAKDISQMNIKADVSEADIGQARDQQPVDFTVDAFPDDVFRGQVTQVRKSPTTTQNVVTYQVIISVDNPEEKLFPGMTADVSILVAERKAVLKIPNTALRFTPPEGAQFEAMAGAPSAGGASPPAPDGKQKLPALPPGEKPPAGFSPPDGLGAAAVPQPKLARNQRLVYTTSADGTKLKPVIVKTGITDGVDTEVLEGLSENTAVVTSNLSPMRKAGGFGGGPPGGGQTP